ncbi:SUMF1/EgtB/PvdO family nonheme iron enzyme [Pseudomonas sp. NPDC007930]|uniref:formylglycine-generating enzyme family protein n=1 Tax=Pseudomonas sp. NPDC007930 TaxID=3364417 RepID=UPI0036F1339C
MFNSRPKIHCRGLACCFVGITTAVTISGCNYPQAARPDTAAPEVDAQRIRRVLDQLTDELVWVQGGTFIMGDYGVHYGQKKGYVDINESSKPTHEVELSSYSISKFKITNDAYHTYLSTKGEPIRKYLLEGDQLGSTIPNLPALIDWYEAEAFCKWAATETGLPFALPTEAQWEYAARSRGLFVPISTDTGDWDISYVGASSYDDDLYRGRNLSTDGNRMDYAQSMGWPRDTFTLTPVDYFPPNPLGLYAMTDNGYEWVNDWYDPNYYSVSPRLNPQGPDQPVVESPVPGLYLKTLRGIDFPSAGWRMGYTVSRSFSNPNSFIPGPEGGKPIFVANKTARCAVNAPTPITPSAQPGTH